jgi:hypothetical protein
MPVFTACVAPTLIVEAQRSKVSDSRFTEYSLLLKLLRDVCWMEELKLLSRQHCESEIIGSLGPGAVEDLVFATFHV